MKTIARCSGNILSNAVSVFLYIPFHFSLRITSILCKNSSKYNKQYVMFNDIYFQRRIVIICISLSKVNELDANNELKMQFCCEENESWKCLVYS